MAEPSVSDPIRILIAEDNPGDVRLMTDVLRTSRVPNKVEVTRDGVETLEYLRDRKSPHDPARPDLILLDLNMPRKDGREVLATIKADPDLRRIPVVIFTSSAAESDVLQAYDRHANCYVRKPPDYRQLDDVVRKIENFWFQAATLPSG
jgi:two-component system, chemotaxis family, response regulator Rcp1